MTDFRWLWRGRIPSPLDETDPEHDGDTVTFTIDRGDRDTSAWPLRLLNDYAPELRETGGPETRQFVIDWLTARNVGTWPFLVETFRTSGGRPLKSFERFIAVIRDKDGIALNDATEQFVKDHGYPGGTGS